MLQRLAIVKYLVKIPCYAGKYNLRHLKSFKTVITFSI